ncbi:MAG: protein kinase [Myxococcaceae bacterium]|nr:protein kinase [Myxococcaceae bacterium]
MADARERYVFIKKLAEGGMADVFLARDSGSSPARLCVVKQLLPELRTKKEHVSMFLDEADLAMRLAHPNVVRALDRGTSKEGPFLVLEYLAGYDLDLVIERLLKTGGQVPWQLAVHVIAQTAEGMAYAHALTGKDGKPLNLIHRDLTPSNMFLTFDGVIKVLDFGIARAEERRTRTSTGMLKGKARYLAPELIQQLPGDARVDQFSLGAALFEVLALRPLFTGDNELAVIHAIMEGKRPSLVAPRPDLPAEIDAIYRRMTSPQREDRFPSMAQVATALRATLPADDLRPALAQFLRQHFGADFEAHAALMARLATASTTELRLYFEKGVNLLDALNDPSRLAKTQVAVGQVIPPEARRTPVQPAPPEATALELPPVEEPAASPLRLPDEVEAPVLMAGGARPERPPRPASDPSDYSPGARTWLVPVLLAVALVAGAGLVWRSVAAKPAAPARGSLLVRSQPPGASIRLDNAAVQYRTPAVLTELTEGRHELALEHPDTLPAFTAAIVVARTQQTLDVVLEPREGLLLFDVSPPDAVVTVDGREVALDGGAGRSAPLAAGTYEVQVRAIGYRTQHLSLDVQDGARIPVTTSLVPEPGAQ